MNLKNDVKGPCPCSTELCLQFIQIDIDVLVLANIQNWEEPFREKKGLFKAREKKSNFVFHFNPDILTLSIKLAGPERNFFFFCHFLPLFHKLELSFTSTVY